MFLGVVSVIIPTHNAEDTICRALESVLAQTYPHVECIIVDDGSTDSTRERVQQYLPRVHYRYQHNQERSAARNHGLRVANGEFIAFLDADDYWMPAKLERQVQLFARTPRLGLVYTQVQLVDAQGAFIRNWLGAGQSWPEPGFDSFRRCALMDDFIIAGLSTLMIRKECLVGTSWFAEDMVQAEEWPLALRLAHHWRIDFIPEVLVSYCVDNSYLPEKLDKRHAQDTWVGIVQEAFAQQPNTHQYEDLGRIALAKAYVDGALVDFGVDERRSGVARIDAAFRLAPTQFCRGDSFTKAVAYFASYLYGTFTPIGESLEYVDRVFASLPDSLLQGEKERSATRRLVMAIHAFDAHQRGDSQSVRRLALRDIVCERALLTNRGMQSVYLESYLGHRIYGRIRELARKALNSPR